MGARNVSSAVLSGAFTADSGAVGAALTLTLRYVRENGLNDATAARLNIVVEELVANLCDHAALPPDASIGLVLEEGPSGTVLTLTDPGPPFDPRHFRPCGDLPPERGGGAGLALVKAWARIESYGSTGGLNILRLCLPDQGKAGLPG